MSTTKTPTWFLVVSILFLLWNLMGLSAFIHDMMQTPESIAQMDADMQLMYQDIPMWNWVAYGLAVITGTLACIGLLLKKKWAHTLFGISLVGVLVQNFFNFFVSDAMSQLGTAYMVMPMLVIAIAVLEWWLSKKWIARGWLS